LSDNTFRNNNEDNTLFKIEEEVIREIYNQKDKTRKTHNASVTTNTSTTTTTNSTTGTNKHKNNIVG